MMRRCDVVVIGGGHAGCEAAAAAARAGAQTILLTHRFDTIGTMSCNPAIGGLGKGHLVREIDALDGLMGRCADAAGIQFRMLNRRKGPAVQGPRAQSDRALYRRAMGQAIRAQNDLEIVEGEAADLRSRNGRAGGVILADGSEIACGAVVITTGTFLRGLIHIGETTVPAGRVGEAPAVALASSLQRLGLRLGRLKTGTPPRLDGRTIAWSELEEQRGDDPPEPFSTMTDRITAPQVACAITRTGPETHAIIRRNLSRSAMYSGRIESRGPRYCPSIEDKVVRFPDRDSHQIFLEPEGIDDDTVYPNGISTSLPQDVQAAIVRSLPGLHEAKIVRAGYAIEYDHVDPRELTPGLELKKLSGLFLAGQINGTTGYEEAAAQGLMAGLNAARHACGEEAVGLSRAEAYIGVMLDDLVTKGVSEPYRMFTSRAEYRLALRVDNADERLTPLGEKWGIVASGRSNRFRKKEAALARLRAILAERTLTPSEAARHGLSVNLDGVRRTGMQLLAYPEISYGDLARIWPELGAAEDAHLRQVTTDARYAVYLERQNEDVEALKREEAVAIPGDFAYGALAGLSNELRERLEIVRPGSLAQAARIEGMTPAALTLILGHLRKGSRERRAA